MQKIVPFLWFDKGLAAQAARFYAEVFGDSEILGSYGMDDTPSGEVEILTLRLRGLELQLMSAGPEFRFTPAVSFLAACGSADEAERLWRRLSEGGRELMPFGPYPFGERYAWVEDRYGLSWQILYRKGERAQARIAPSLLFAGEVCGRAEEAIRFYTSVFGRSSAGSLVRYGAGAEPNAPESLMHADFSLEEQTFSAGDSALKHDFGFNEAVSFMVRCGDQAEIDRFWASLSAHPEAEQCGWVKDRFGLSWQIVPENMDELMGRGGPEGRERAVKAMLGMKKLDIAALEAAARG